MIELRIEDRIIADSIGMRNEIREKTDYSTTEMSEPTKTDDAALLSRKQAIAREM